MNIVPFFLVLIATVRATSIPAAAAAQAITPLPTIEVTAPKDFATVKALTDTMSALSQKVTSCIDAGGAAERCRCSDPQDLNQLRNDYKHLMKQRPEWKDKLLSYHYINSEGRNISGVLALQNVRRQLEALTCR